MKVFSRQFIQQLLLLAVYFVVTPTAVFSQVSSHVKPGQDAALYSANNAVILMYHHVSDVTSPTTSVSPEIFKQHMAYLAENNYVVWPLFKTLLYLSAGKAIPEKTVVLSFDDAYRSVYTEAFPVLKQYGWPFTVFVTTKYIMEEVTQYMSWPQLRDIQQSGGEIGNHSLNHPHMIRQRVDETDAQWYSRISNEVTQAQNVLRQQGVNPIWAFAYPYGEYSHRLGQLVRELGYFGLGQHSGAVSRHSDFQMIPRFPISSAFSELDDFIIKVSSKNLPVSVLSPVDGLVAKDTDIPVLRIRLEAGDYNKQRLACYASGQGRIQLDWLDKEQSIVEVRANNTIPPGRTKYNCTAPSLNEKNIFYWFSFLWIKAEADGSWYKE